MLDRNGGHTLTCVNDGACQIPPTVVDIRMPAKVAALPDYLPKLWAWSADLHNRIGERFASIDLDVVITGDLAPVLDTKHKLLIWNHARMERYNSSLFALEPGYGNKVWDRLTEADLKKAKEWAPYWTGDQSWISYVLGAGEATFGENHGVMQYRPAIHRQQKPPRMIAGFMCGPYEPFEESKHSKWVREAYH